MNRFSIFFLFLSSLIFATSSQAQISFHSLCDESHLIVEGIVINQETLDNNPHSILSTILISKLFKGESADSVIYVITPSTKDAKASYGKKYISLDHEGIFFLNKQAGTYSIENASKNFIQYFYYENEPIAHSNSLGTFDNVYKDLYPLFVEEGLLFRYVSQNKHEKEMQELFNQEPCVDYLVSNLRIEPNSSLEFWLDFDISIRNTGFQPFHLARSFLSVNYSTNVFGENIVASNNLLLSKYESFDDYDLDYMDVSNEEFSINLEEDQNYTEINNGYKDFLNVRLKIENFDLGELLSITVQDQIDVMTFAYTGNGMTELPCSEFNDDVIGVVSSFLMPTIESVNSYNLPAGTRELHSRLVITGTNFGDDHGVDNYVQFQAVEGGPHVVPLPGDYEDWTPTQIIVYVPSNGALPEEITPPLVNKLSAGTGSISVHVNSMSIDAEEPLYIPYSARNDIHGDAGEKNGQPILLKDVFDGGYKVTLDESIRDFVNEVGVNFTDALEDAIGAWCEKTDLNFQLDKSIVVPDADCTNDIRISVDNSLEEDHPGLTRAYPEEVEEAVTGIAVDCDLLKCVELKINVDALKNSSYNNVYSIFLHELGHAHGLLHVRNLFDLMHPVGDNMITPEAKMGSNYIQDVSELISYERGDCTSSVNESIVDQNYFSSFLLNNRLSISFEEPELVDIVKLYDILGNEIISYDVQKKVSKLEKSISLVSGTYVILVKFNDGSFSTKIQIYND